MNNNITTDNISSPFDSIRHFEDEQEFWYARELMPILGYVKWERFGAKQSKQVSVISKAIISCNIAGNVSSDHFIHLPHLGKTQRLNSRNLEN